MSQKRSKMLKLLNSMSQAVLETELDVLVVLDAAKRERYKKSRLRKGGEVLVNR